MKRVTFSGGARVLAALGPLALLLASAAQLMAAPHYYIFQAGGKAAFHVGGWLGSTDTTIIGTSSLWKDTSIHYGTWNENNNYGAEDSLQLSSILCDSLESIVLMQCNFETWMTANLSANVKITRAWLAFRDIAAEKEAVAIPTTNDLIVWVYRCMTPWTEGIGNGASFGTPSTDGSAGASGHYASNGLGWGGLFDPGTSTIDGQYSTQNGMFWRTGTLAARDTNSTGSTGFWGTDSLENYLNGQGSDNGSAFPDTANIPVNPEAQYYVRTRRSPPAGAAADIVGTTIIDVTHFCKQVRANGVQNNGWVFTNSTSALAKRTFYASHEHATVQYRPYLVIEAEATGGTTVLVSGGLHSAGHRAGAIH